MLERLRVAHGMYLGVSYVISINNISQICLCNEDAVGSPALLTNRYIHLKEFRS